VCNLGVGQWDYSTRIWRSKSRFNLTHFQGYPLPEALQSIPSLAHSALPPPLQTFSYDAKNCSSLSTTISFIEAPGHVNGMDNRQTRMLAGAKLEPDSAEERTVEQL
jgi:hypothetical protein